MMCRENTRFVSEDELRDYIRQKRGPVVTQATSEGELLKQEKRKTWLTYIVIGCVLVIGYACLELFWSSF